VDARPTGDPILDNALLNISGARKPRKARDWLLSHQKLAPSLQERLLDRLVQAGVLRRETREVLWVFHFKRYPTEEERPERAIRKEIHGVLFEGKAPTPDCAALLCLIHACSLGREVFPDHPHKETQQRLKAFAESDRLAKAVTESIAAVTMLIMSIVLTSTTMYPRS
ncbi:MAG: hypothetical protein CVU65_16730, partial [Deltaproteobacteria bacterium HGW-Deltaproteobacteria-22]